MKKILLFCLALAALTFTSCDKNEADGYTLTVSANNVTIGDDVVVTITGDNAENMDWEVCYKEGGCLVVEFDKNKATIDTSNFKAGTYTLYAHAELGEDMVETNTCPIVVNE